jgi:hypothetical protein
MAHAPMPPLDIVTEKIFEAIMSFDIAWNRKRLDWRRHPQAAPWLIEAILCERILIEGKPQMKIVARLAAINEDRAAEIGERDYFWNQARKKLGKLRRLDDRDRWQIESLLDKKIPRISVGNTPTCGSVRPAANPITGPHQPLLSLRAR